MCLNSVKELPKWEKVRKKVLCDVTKATVQVESRMKNTASQSVGGQFDYRETSSCFLHILLIHLTCFVPNGICSVYPGGVARKGTDIKESPQTLVMREPDSGPLNISHVIQLDESRWKRAGLDIISSFPRHTTKEARIDPADFFMSSIFCLGWCYGQQHEKCKTSAERNKNWPSVRF